MKIAATSLFLMQKDKGRFALQNSALATVQEEKKKGGGRKGRRGEENGGEGGREVGGGRGRTKNLTRNTRDHLKRRPRLEKLDS